LDDFQTSPKNLRLRALALLRTSPLRLAKEIIVPSGYLRRIVCGWGFPQERVRLVYNSVPPASPAQTAPVMLPAWSGKTLITVCRLVRWKGVDALIRLLPQLPETRLVVAGDGHMRAEFSALASTAGVAERVLFLGDVPHASVREYLRQADAFVLNSSYEGLPHVVLEAMAAHIPVIATNAGGTGEVVENNVTGLLIPVGDTAALQGAIQRLWSDPSLGRQLAEQAARQVSAHFEFDTMVNATESALISAADLPAVAQSRTVEEPR
jgi:glycosyltransferase involved in cell wall biosynthesis